MEKRGSSMASESLSSHRSAGVPNRVKRASFPGLAWHRQQAIRRRDAEEPCNVRAAHYGVVALRSRSDHGPEATVQPIRPRSPTDSAEEAKKKPPSSNVGRRGLLDRNRSARSLFRRRLLGSFVAFFATEPVAAATFAAPLAMTFMTADWRAARRAAMFLPIFLAVLAILPKTVLAGVFFAALLVTEGFFAVFFLATFDPSMRPGCETADKLVHLRIRGYAFLRQ